MKQFEGKVALVVAATRGIGLACAQGLAQGRVLPFIWVCAVWMPDRKLPSKSLAKGGKAAAV